VEEKTAIEIVEQYLRELMAAHLEAWGKELDALIMGEIEEQKIEKP